MDHTKNAVAIFDKLAVEYQDKFMDTGLYHETFDIFCEYIKNENAQILELACGPGNITRYLLNKRPDFKILGIDLAPKMLKLAKINNPFTEFRLMDCRDIGKLKKTYDGIMCGFCLPYLTKEESAILISDAAKLLKPGGAFYLSTMEADYDQSGYKLSSSGERMYMYYHQADYLTHVLLENNFKLIDLQRKVYVAQDGTETTDLVIISGKEHPVAMN